MELLSPQNEQEGAFDDINFDTLCDSPSIQQIIHPEPGLDDEYLHSIVITFMISEMHAVFVHEHKEDLRLSMTLLTTFPSSTSESDDLIIGMFKFGEFIKNYYFKAFHSYLSEPSVYVFNA